jgi:hypothetical protein
MKKRCGTCHKPVDNKILMYIWKGMQYVELHFCSNKCFIDYLKNGKHRISDDFVVTGGFKKR